MNFNSLMMEDNEIYQLIIEEKERQQNTLEMIASENFTSRAIMEAMGSYLTNKYAEGYPNKRYYGGCEIIDKIENLAIERAKQLFKAEHVNVQPHSGSQANFAVYQALLKPKDKILTLELTNYAHLTHGSPVNFSGKLYNIVTYKIDKNGFLDLKDFKKQLYKEKPRMVIAGTSAYPREIHFSKYREIIDAYNFDLYSELLKENNNNSELAAELLKDVECIFFVDMAHIAGLVAAGLHESPIPYADVVSTTTHKTLRGPRGGLILCKEKYAKKIDSSVFPSCQGGPLEHVIAAKAVCFKEAMTEEFKQYQQQIINNTAELAKVFRENNINMVTGGTDNHLILLDLRNLEITGKEAQERLEKFHIATNKNTIPNEKQKPTITSGLRLGTAALTTRGFKEKEIREVGQIICDILTNNINEEEINMKIKELCSHFPLYED